ncbi:hypothetical protein D9758_003109 [Tetrapyrgos nigripes]|uniref:BHLH domain-containing protein n=1 Tax=Tetrapyrgos nigripes TaxID=182062 RepID=A0A8H5GQ26_9AGAR|nr:hypothetical protein D9758_003109 [Tetrapyrgos nigripes]
MDSYGRKGRYSSHAEYPATRYNTHTQNLSDPSSYHYHHFQTTQNVDNSPIDNRFPAYVVDESSSVEEETFQLFQKDHTARSPDLSPLPTEAFSTLNLNRDSLSPNRMDHMETTAGTGAVEVEANSNSVDHSQQSIQGEGTNHSNSSASDAKPSNRTTGTNHRSSSENATQDVPSFSLSPFFTNIGLDSGVGNSFSFPSQLPASSQPNLNFLTPNTGNMGMGGVIAALQGIDQPASSTSGGTSGEGVSQQLLLEQVKLAQLQQLQQLQDQIFQQQMAIINSTSQNVNPNFTSQAIAAISNPQRQSKSAAVHAQHNSSDPTTQEQNSRAGRYGLPTPGSSTELRASDSPVPIEFVSPMILNYSEMENAGLESIDIDDMGTCTSSSTRNYPSSNYQQTPNHSMSATHTPIFGATTGTGVDSDADMDQLPPLTPMSASGSQSQQHVPRNSSFSEDTKQNTRPHPTHAQNPYPSRSFDPQNPARGSQHSSPYLTSQYHTNSANLHLNTDFPPSSPSLSSGFSITSNSSRGHDYYLSNRGTSSAPAHLAFGNPVTGFANSSNSNNAFSHQLSTPVTPLPAELDFDVSPLTSPWLGAEMGGSSGRVQPYHRHHAQQQQFTQQPFSQGQKRSASPTMADSSTSAGGDSMPSRKRQMSISQSPLVGPSSASKRGGPRKGSRSTTSTPLMKGVNPSAGSNRRVDVMNNQAMMNSSPMFSAVFGTPGSGHLGAVSNSGYFGSSSGMNGGNANNNAGNVVGDSPSPVDLSMPPPAAPSTPSVDNSSTNTSQTGPQMGPPLMPVTPASIMNMRSGRGNGLASGASQTPIATPGMESATSGLPEPSLPSTNMDFSPNVPPDSSNASSSKAGVAGKGRGGRAAGKQKEMDVVSNVKESGGVTTRRSTRKAATASSTAASSGVGTVLKTILPASPIFPSNSSSMQPSSSSSSHHQLPAPAIPLQVRKTSHKAAEQKRRDSLKTTFDDLRGLLPPIPLPTDPNNPAQDDGSGVGFLAVAKASLLPGALPPRGPPKSGGDGPNKGVSKLQLLICGNEYIRVLKGRVERRDEEILRLRREVVNLRNRLNESEVGMEFGEEEFDLDRDIDAVEMLNYQQRIAVQTDVTEPVMEEDDEGE